MFDFETQKTIDSLNRILNDETLEKIKNHLYSLARQIEDLTKSRNDWKMKYEELKINNSNKNE